MKLAGSEKIGDQIREEVHYPISYHLLGKCDAVLRIEGASKGVNMNVKIAKERGIKVYFDPEEIRGATSAP